MKSRYIFSYLLIVFVWFPSSAKISNNRDSIQSIHAVDSLVIRGAEVKDSIEENVVCYKILQDSLVKRDIEVHFLLDSINRLNDALRIANETFRVIESKMKQNDSIKLKLANCRLKERFTEKKNAEAIRYLKSIETKEIKEGDLYKKLLSLTCRYESDFNDIVEILKEAQFSSDRTNPFCSDFASNVINKLRQTSYYMDLYKEDWNIPYLKKLIDDAIAKLRKHDGDKNIVDFSRLI